MSELRRELVLLGLVLLLAAVARTWGLATQPVLEDEALTALSAEHYVGHGQFGPTEPFHPNLRNLVLAASTRAFGTGAVGLRGPSVLLGTLSVWVLFALVRRLTKDCFAALLAALFLAVDPVHITFSRQSLQEVHTAFFFLAGVYAFVRAHDERWSLARPAWWPLAGVCFGLSVASKHHGLFPLIACASAAGFFAIRRRDWPALALAVSALLLLPATVYLATYYPWFGRGHGLGEWFAMQVALAGEMVTHQGYATSSAIDTRPGLWFVQPLLGYANFTVAGGRPIVTVAMGNPLIFLLVLPAALLPAFAAWRSRGAVFLAALFWVCYLPLALSPRPIWLLSSIAVTPFAFALVAAALCRAGLAERRGALAGFVGALLLVSLALYPMATARAWELDYLRPLVARFNPH